MNTLGTNARWTLDDYIVYLYSAGKTQTAEYLTMSKIFGEEKLKGIWNSYQEKHKIPFYRTEAGEDWD